MDKKREPGTVDMTVNAYKDYLSSDEGKQAVAESVADTAAMHVRQAAGDAVRDAIHQAAPDLHMEYRNSIFGKVEDVAYGAKLLGGLFKKKK